MRLLLNVLHPVRKPGGPYPLATLLAAIAFGIAAGFLGGWFSARAYDAAYFKAHYQATLPLPRTVAAVPYKPHAVASSASINVSYYPAVGDQDGQGSCAAWATAWDLSYLWRVSHTHSWLRFSPRQMYSHYSDTYSNGFDAGSWPDQDAEISSTTGLLQFKADPEPPYQIDNPELPLYDAWGHLSTTDAAKHRFLTTFTALSGYSMGGGPGLVQSMQQAIAAGHPVLLAFPVYPEYDQANAANPYIGLPQPGETDRGGHENVALAYDDAKQAFLIQNQWTTRWGLNGRAWMSYGFVEQYVFGAEYAGISPSTGNSNPPGVAPPFTRNHNPGHKAPHVVGAKRPSSGLWYVHGVVTQDTHVDISGMLNHWGDVYGVAPVGLAATAGIESSIHQYADRCCTPGDTSFGLTQETTGTVCSYVGICSIDGVRNYLDNLNNSIALEAHYYHDAYAYHGGRVQFPALYGTYNCGPGLSDWFYNTYQDCHSDAFAGWWNYAIANFAGGSPPPPPPPPFPFRIWHQFRLEHHKPLISPHYHGRLSLAASQWRTHNPKYLGGILGPEQWFWRLKVMKTKFQGWTLYTWPTHHGYKPKWVRRPPNHRWVR